MKFKGETFCALMLAGVFGITPLCHAETSSEKSSMEEVKQEAQDLLQTLGAYTADQKEEAVKKTKVALDNLDRRIDALESRVDENWDKMGKTGRDKARASLRAVRKQRTQVAEWYGSLKNSSGDAWTHMKKGFSDAYKELNEAWEKSAKELDSNK